MNAIIDTCVIIDALQNREPFSKEAKQIFEAAANNEFNGYVTANSLTDVYYLAHKTLHDNLKSREIIRNLLTLFNVLDTEGIDCEKAISSKTQDYEDAIMIEIASRSNIDCIITRNTKDFADSPVKIYTPKNFLKIKNNKD